MSFSESKDETSKNQHDDWPLNDNEISLDIHDLPHQSSNIEWWYCNGHLNDSNNNNEYSIFASFFRTVDNYRSTSNQIYYLHALVWGIIDIKNHEYYSSSLLDRQTIVRILNGTELLNELDKNLYHAYKEMLNKNNLPLPDRLCEKECQIDLNKFSLNYDDNLFTKDNFGHYHLYCHDKYQNISLELEMQPLKTVCKQAHNGIVKNTSNREAMFYYFIPRLKCHGKITINNQSIPVHGQSWYDHEFGGCIKYNNSNPRKSETTDCAWYWFSIQLDNQYDITFSYLFDSIDHSLIDKSLLIIGPNNERFEYDANDQIELQPLNNWFSARTGCAYTTKWKIIIPKIQCELILEAVFNNQEFITIISRPSFWEGRLNVHGYMNNELVNGYAFFECHGSNINLFKSLDRFFKRISKIVLNNIENILPRKPTYEQAINLIANQENKYLLDTLDLDIFSKTIISPLRDIIDRGGKAWRSFLCLLCVDCVGSDSRKFEHWSSLAEILHVGSLIIDDIQDQSDIRRGGPACHLLHGIAQTINSGTAAYFLTLHTLIEQTPQLTMELKLKIYETTFFTLRAAHVGQGLDIYGLDYLMDEVIQTGDSLPLEQAIVCIHRLKSGVPAGSLARMGAIIGQGTKEQCDVLENYIQSIGIAFQIIDDVLNLRGFEKDTKQRGEDIMAGKITFPIAKAMNRKCLNDQLQRKCVWDIIKNKTTNIIIINNLIELLENCDCINQSVLHAKSLVEDAWIKLDPIIPDSFYKLILRAFGFYILERYY